MHINSALKIEFFKARHRIVHALLKGFVYSIFLIWILIKAYKPYFIWIYL